MCYRHLPAHALLVRFARASSCTLPFKWAHMLMCGLPQFLKSLLLLLGPLTSQLRVGYRGTQVGRQWRAWQRV